MILAGDIGATNTRLALFRLEDPASITSATKCVTEQRFLSHEYANLREIVRAFVAQAQERPSRACFGVAGPVRDGRGVATNLPWVVDQNLLSQELQLPHEKVLVVNDLEANAYGIAALGPQDLLTLREGSPGAKGNCVLVSAGTGLGEAGLFWDGREHRPFACEGGHATFAASTPLQFELHQWLLKKISSDGGGSRRAHVSWERVVSGPGLVSLYEFLRETGRGEQPAWLATELRHGDPAPVISRNALAGKSALCEKALDLFVELYGAEAGNAALKIMATGGVYIGGGIAPRILPKMKSVAFQEAFLAKGRMRPLLESMALRIILNERAALLGAVRRALMD